MNEVKPFHLRRTLVGRGTKDLTVFSLCGYRVCWLVAAVMLSEIKKRIYFVLGLWVQYNRRSHLCQRNHKGAKTSQTYPFGCLLK